ncbi:methylenetetrahydrofolate reductase [Balneolaceae bacterium ANBcel3]|nr:methylenetetrahydrofolate reductase [Balneolaceae bacterium ANBcel3]
MKVIDHYSRTRDPLISFEIIPPRRGGSVSAVFHILDELQKYHPPFIDVTSHAAEVYYDEKADGSLQRKVRRKRPGTIGLCAAIKHRYNVDPVPHLICKGFTKEETEDALIELNYLGIDNVLAIRGDDHGDQKRLQKDRGLNVYASDLVNQISDMNKGIYLEPLADAHPTSFCIGVGGYPEKHIEAPNLAYDIGRLKEKIDAGAEYIVTQMFFDNSGFFNFVSLCREAGIQVPIIPGLKILSNPRHLTTLPGSFHLTIPEDLSREVEKKPEHTLDIGVEWAVRQCRELLDYPVPGLHFYVMGNPEPAIRVIDQLDLFPFSTSAS